MELLSIKTKLLYYKIFHIKFIGYRNEKKKTKIYMNKPVSFIKFLFFSPNDSPSKTMKNVFYSSKKLFSFLRYSNFFPSFQNFPDSKGQIEVE